MIPAKFDYVRPGSLDEAVSALPGAVTTPRSSRAGRACCRCCGCGSPTRNCWSTWAAWTSCAAVTDAGDALVIGARTTLYDLVRDPLVAEHAGIFAQTASVIADPAVRHRATLGGALAHADPAGDLPAVVLALDATLIARGPGGEREIPAADFFVDYLTTSLQPTRS